MPDQSLPPFEPGEQLCPACVEPTTPRTTPHKAGCLVCKPAEAYERPHVARTCTECGYSWPELMGDDEVTEE